MRYAIALDLGTSGFRCQAIDIESNETVSTAITTRHPIPGMNVMDHVNFAMESGSDVANGLMIQTVKNLFKLLRIDLNGVERVAVCGNPFQLSLFQNIEIRDLAFAGKSMLERLGVVPPKRDGDIIPAVSLGLDSVPNAEVLIPPAVTHEIGADAMAMLLETGVIDTKDTCIVVDYGTNAEMALIHEGQIFTGSAAAGPALEGQQIKDGMLAAPGAISDIEITGKGWLCWVLDESFKPLKGDTVDPVTGHVAEKGEMHGRAVGITGTGVIAAIACGMKSGLISGSKISCPGGRIALQDGVSIYSKDVDEAGKAIGALRSGFLTLMLEAGIWVEDVPVAYMSGASGLYVDAEKAQAVGMVTPCAKKIIQLGNTSILLARREAKGMISLDDLRRIAQNLRARHCMFASSQAFKDIYSIEISLWSYGMPQSAYNEMMDVYGLPDLPAPIAAEHRRVSHTDLPEVDSGIEILNESGVRIGGTIEGCISCGSCAEECPESAIEMDGDVIDIRSDLCMGTACKRCERICPEKVLHIKQLRIKV